MGNGGGLKEPGYTATAISNASAGQGFQNTGVAAELHLNVSANSVSEVVPHSI